VRDSVYLVKSLFSTVIMLSMSEPPKFDYGDTLRITGQEHKGRIGVVLNKRLGIVPLVHGGIWGRALPKAIIAACYGSVQGLYSAPESTFGGSYGPLDLLFASHLSLCRPGCRH
jgi:hypothetical protein